MRVVVFAYHNMGIAGLNALERAGYQIVCIFSHEDDPDENCWFGSVKNWGAERGIPVESPAEIRPPEWQERISALRPEMIFSFYYRHMIREEILRIPPKGAYNLHGSLLPAYRGRCPVNWVLVHGETQTGVTLHHMVKKADAGDIVGQKIVPISQKDTAVMLYGKLCDAAGILLDEFLPLMKIGQAPRIPQDLCRGSYFGGRRPEDGRIDWNWTASRIYNLIRAVTDPYPGAFCKTAEGSKFLIWRGMLEEGRGKGKTRPPGFVEIDGDRILVWTGQGRIHLLDVQIGDERRTGDKILRYFEDKEGIVLS
jgi:methionyl-tRNA formyltransferase